VAVFEESVGGALVIDRKVYRGSHGMAGEIGHLTVDYARPHQQSSSGSLGPGSGTPGFDHPCLCAAPAKAGTRATGSGYGHVNALATPIRIAGELGIDSSRLHEAARGLGTSRDGQITRAGAVFRTAGEALGRGIAAMLNIANPGNLLLLLPPELAQPAEGTAAAHYTQAIEQALDKECFSTAAADARAGRGVLKIEPMSLDDLREARPARVTVLDSFIAHARGENAESLADTIVVGSSA
jgi:predicted NBD/HSP70 family sugar kinase